MSTSTMRTLLKNGILLLLASLFIKAQAQYTPGTSYFGRNRYIEYIAGNMPFIISAPHGGTLTPTGIKTRTETLCNDTSNFSIAEDTNTDDVVRALDTAFRNLIGCRPHTIICRLDRSKVDCNRDIETGACGDSLAKITWNDYHNFINIARSTLRNNFSRGLYIDFHGHGHTIQRLELGYGLSAAELRASDAYLNRTSVRNGSTIRNLATNNIQKLTHAQLIRGNQAFGTLMANAGFPSVPSLQDSSPGVGEDYFNGGYNVRRYGTADSGVIDAFQIESNWTNVRNNTTSIKRFTDSLARIIVRYLQLHSIPLAQINNCKTILPLDLAFFRGSQINNSNQLSWQTLCTVNGDAVITLERSYDLQYFEPVFSSMVKLYTCLAPYTYTDTALQSNKTAFYRLKMTDVDGKIGFSKIVSLSALPEKFRLQKIIPNPANSSQSIQIAIEAASSCQLTIVVTDVFGKMVHRQHTFVQKGSRQVPLELTQPLARGLYFVNCWSGERNKSVEKLIIQ